MNYKSFADLSKDIKQNLHKIPKEVTLVVGIPRSGLLAANLIALYANLPLTDIDSFLSGKILCPGYQDSALAEKAFKGKILIVDDSVATGKAIVDAREKLKPVIDAGTYQLLFCCIYADPDKKHLVDIPLMLLSRPRVFEWNLFHNKIIEKSAVQLEGVLACAPDESENAGKSFNSLLHLQPFIIPKQKIGAVFHQSEKLNEAKNWLQQHNVRFHELVADENLNVGQAYKKRKQLTLFVTGKKQHALQILESSGKNVYCMESNTIYTKHPASGLGFQLQNKVKLALHKLKRVLKLFNF